MAWRWRDLSVGLTYLCWNLTSSAGTHCQKAVANILVLFLLDNYDNDELLFAGRVGTGFSEKALETNGAKISIAFVEDGGELHAFYDGVLSGMDKPWGGVSWLLARNG